MKSLIVSITMFLCISLSAQNSWQDVVYLKNGSKIKGMITEFVPNVSYTITTSDGSIFVCNIGDILKIAKEQVILSTIPPKNDSLPLTKALEHPQSEYFTKGYRGIVELGYGLKSGKYGLDVTNFNFVNGYQLSNQMFVGLGTGIKYFNESEMTLIPLYADFKYSFLDQKVSPMLGFSAGFSFNPNKGFEGEGFLFNPSLGAQIKGKNKMRYNISLNYQTQQINFIVLEPGGAFFTNAIRFSESAGLTLGLVF
ncbi:MAG: hypothetical protein ACKOXF_12525 [Chitinophagaceae bacterium]